MTGRALAAGGIYFALVFALGFLLGGARQALMGLGLERTLLVAAEIPVMLAFAWWAAGCVRRLALPNSWERRCSSCSGSVRRPSG